MKARSAASITVQEVIRRYYTVWLIYSFAGGFLFGIYPTFLASRGLDQFEINSVLATYFVVLFLTDVPTGAFADALGRRRSFVLGSMLRVLAFTIYFFARRYWMFLVAESIDGIGTTFANGAVDAWGVDALDDAGYDGLKDRLFSRISQLTNAGFMASAMIGAYVAEIDIAWPWLLGATGYAMSAGVGGWQMRGEKRPRGAVDLNRLARQLAPRVADGVRAGWTNRPVLLLSAAGALQFAAWAPYWLEWPIMFNRSYGVGVWIIGWIYCLLTLARMGGAEIASRLSGRGRARASAVSALAVAAGVALAVAGLFERRPNLALSILFVMNICVGALIPLAQSWLNEQIESSRRATLLSFFSTFGTLGGSMGLLLGGYVADTAGFSAAWQVAGVITLAAAPCYLAIRRQESARAAAA